MEVWAKSETVDPEVRAYIYSLVNAVGGQSTLDSRYAIGDDALAVLNDLLRWLRLYDEKTNRFDVKRCLAEASLVKGDLLEILALWPEEEQESRLKAKLALACLQLLVPLTWPIALEEDKTTVNHLRHTPYLKLAQVAYKRAVLHFEDASILRTVIRVGLPSMALERRERTKRDEGIIKMVLYFLRNIAMITQPQELPSQGDENDISRSATIDTFHAQDVFSLLLTVSSGASDEFQEQDVILLETLFHLLKGIDAQKLFMQQSQLATEETGELANLIRKEKAMLNSYNKHAPTRHNRFGTMLWVKRAEGKMSTVTGQSSITDESTTLIQMDRSKKWNKPKFRGKKTLDNTETSDFAVRVDLTESARQHLQTFVEDFLDSGFNPLFARLRRSIERDSDMLRVGKETAKQYFYLISWFLAAESSRREAQRSSSTAEENTFAYIAAVLDQETFVLLNRRMQSAFDEKLWHELHATVLAFTQILLTVQNMAGSADEEDQEIAENIQNRIFYEESTQERIVQILRAYSPSASGVGQGFSYLDAVTECVHVFVRMLERYSKQNVDLQVRSKRRARRKKKQQQQQSSNPNENDENPDEGQDHNNDDEDDGADDTAEAYRAVSERKFDFTRFSAKFLTQPCLHTFLALLHLYADLSPAQLKRCHRYFHRLAFKNELVVLLFRVDILALFHKLIKGPGGLDPAAEGFKEWEQLVQQIFRRCVKWLEREQETDGEGWREAAVVEMLFSKIPQTVFYLQNGYERVVEHRAPRPPAELEVKRSVVGLEERVGVVVCVLLELGKGDAVEWIRRILRGAAEERGAWEELQRAQESGDTAMETEGGDGAATTEKNPKPEAPTILVTPDTDERKSALFKDKYLRLLLTEAGFQRLGSAEDVNASWIIPSELTAEHLKKTLSQIEKTEFDPPSFDEGKTAQDLIRNKSSARRGADDQNENDIDSGSDREIESAFPPNIRSKRKPADGEEEQQPKKKRRLTRRTGGELTEAEAAAKAEERCRKERERNSKIKSQLYVTASDDESDAEADEAFFRQEEQRRKKMRGVIRKALAKEGENGKKEGLSELHVLDETEDDTEGTEKSPSHRALGFLTDESTADERSSEDEDVLSDVHRNSHRKSAERPELDEETPSTSPTSIQPVLNEVASNVAGLTKSATAAAMNVVDEMDEDEDDTPIVKPSAIRRNVRAGFIVESDSE